MKRDRSAGNPGSPDALSSRHPPAAQPPAAVTHLRDWLGLERNILVMLGAILILGMGEDLWMRFVPKYLELLGASVWVIAMYGTLKDLLDAVYQYPGGWLADRLGRRATLVLFTGLAIVGYGIYLFSPRWEWVLIGTFFVMAWSSLTSPAIFAIIGDNLPQTRRAIGFGVQSILKRAPKVVAPPLGGSFPFPPLPEPATNMMPKPPQRFPEIAQKQRGPTSNRSPLLCISSYEPLRRSGGLSPTSYHILPTLTIPS